MEGWIEGRLAGRLEGRLGGRLEGRLGSWVESKLEARLEGRLEALEPGQNGHLLSLISSMVLSKNPRAIKGFQNEGAPHQGGR